jgi:hypothetical protein
MSAAFSPISAAVGSMVLAQATIEYAGAAGVAALLSTVESTAYRLQASFQEHPLLWVGGAVLALWLFARRS